MEQTLLGLIFAINGGYVLILWLLDITFYFGLKAAHSDLKWSEISMTYKWTKHVIAIDIVLGVLYWKYV